MSWLVPAFFISYLIIGLILVPDYGMSWDEAVQRRYGLVALDFYIEKFNLSWEKAIPVASLETAAGRQYPTLFSTICAISERALGLQDDFRGRYLMRHYAVFLLFWLSTLFFYKLLLLSFRKQWLALLGTFLLLLSPRIFAHSFFNPKDIVLLAFYVIASFSMIRFLQSPSWKTAVGHGLASALVINARILGIYIPALTLLGLVLVCFRKNAPLNSRQPFRLALPIYVLVGSLLTFLFWPYLWSAPFERAQESFEMMSNFPWGASVLYFGTFIKGAEVPWHYPIIWMGITTPLIYLIGFLLGLILIIPPLLKAGLQLRFWENGRQQVNFFFLALFFGPLFAILWKSATLYNGWRQLFFLYPILLLIAMNGLYFLLKHPKKNLQWLVIAALAYSGGQPLRFMVRNHPHQQVYFNALVGKTISDRFDMDYWGVAYKQALEQIVANDTTSLISVNCANYPCEDNVRFLPEPLRKRIKLRYGPEVATYFLSNFRRKEAFTKYQTGAYPYRNPVFFIEVEGERIIGVFKPN